MVVPEQAAPKLVFQTSIAVPWAVEPAAISEPGLPQVIAAPAAAEPLEPDAVEVPLLLSEPQAASDSELTSAMAPMARALERPFRWSFTGVSLSVALPVARAVRVRRRAGFAVVRGPCGPPVVPKLGGGSDTTAGHK